MEWDIQPRILNLGEPATATITFHGTDAPGSLGLPDIDGLSIQPAGRSSNTSFVNGRTTSSITFNYTIFPRRAGDFILGPYQLSGPNGEDPIDLPAITLTVRAPDPDAPQSEMLFARVEASTPAPYVQQSFDLILRIYALPTVELARDIRLSGGFPESGFVQSAFEELQTVREETSGQIYVVRRFRARFRALTAGDFDIAPVLRVGVVDRSSRNARRRNSPFGDFFDDPFFNPPAATPVDLAAPPLTLHVRPVPAEDRPADYAGAVGQYRFEADVRPRELKVGEPLTVTLRVTGRGNIATVRPPSYTDTDLYKTYEARQSGDSPDPAADTGTKTFEQVVIPRSPDLDALPALTFTYFDPDANSYLTATAGPFPLTVHESDTSSSALLVQIPDADTPDRARALILGTDIVYLQPAPTRWLDPTASPLPRRILLAALFALPPLLLLALHLTTRRRHRLTSDVAFARRLQAPRVARAALRRAEAAARGAPHPRPPRRLRTPLRRRHRLLRPPPQPPPRRRHPIRPPHRPGKILPPPRRPRPLARILHPLRRHPLRRLPRPHPRRPPNLDPNPRHSPPPSRKDPPPMNLPMSPRGASAPSSLLPLFALLFSLFTLHFSLAAPPAQPDPSRLFVEASRAYDENRLDDAITSLQLLLDSGQTLPPVLYNLGNALYRSGRLGEAIRCYRQAQWLAPRDPDIRANLGFAAQTAGIDLPRPSAPVAILLTLTTREWLCLALVSLWLLCLLAAVSILLPRTRPPLRLPAALLSILLILSLAGITASHLQTRHPEYVLLSSAPLLSAPLETSTPLLSLPEGTIVRALASHGTWLQVRVPSNPTPGWLPLSALAPVLPPASPS